MTIDKIHARSSGPIHILTHQPVEGRNRNGGLRFGEMERDNVITYGATEILLDRLVDQSDAYWTVVCDKCGIFAIPSERDHKKKNYDEDMDVQTGLADRPFCRVCQSYDFVRPLKIPYAFKLLIQELQACHIGSRMELRKKENAFDVPGL